MPACVHMAKPHLAVVSGSCCLWPWPLADPTVPGTWRGPPGPLGLSLVPHAPLRLPGTLGFIRNKNNKQRVTLYCPAGFHPESSKHFTHQDSSVLSRGPRYPVMGTMGWRALSFPAVGLGANRVSSMVGNQVASRSVVEVKLD